MNVLITTNWMWFSFEELTDEYDRIIIFKEPASNKAFNGHVIRTEEVTDEKSCRVEFYLEPNCVSVNVGPNDGGHQVCELNSATDESPELSDLSERKGYTYHGIEVLTYNDSNNTTSYLDIIVAFIVYLFSSTKRWCSWTLPLGLYSLDSSLLLVKLLLLLLIGYYV